MVYRLAMGAGFILSAISWWQDDTNAILFGGVIVVLNGMLELIEEVRKRNPPA